MNGMVKEVLSATRPVSSISLEHVQSRSSAAAFIRSLGALLSGEKESLTPTLALHVLSTQLPAVRLDKHEAILLLDKLTAALRDKNMKDFGLKVIVHVVKQAPSTVLQKTLGGLGMQVVAVVKGARSDGDISMIRKGMLVLAATIMGGVGLVQKSKIFGGLIEAAMAQILCALKEEVAAKESVIALRACMEAYPLGIRRFAGKLRETLWAKLGEEGVADAIVSLVGCRGEKGKSEGLYEALTRVQMELEELVGLVNLFRDTGAETQVQKLDRHNEIHCMDHLTGDDILARFSGLCRILEVLFSRRGVASCLHIQIEKMLGRVTEILSTRMIDPYTKPIRTVRLNFRTVLVILPALHARALKCVRKCVVSLRRSILLPLAARLCRSISAALKVPKPAGKDTFLVHIDSACTRIEAYRAAAACVSALGSPALRLLGHNICSSIIKDLEVAAEERAKYLALKASNEGKSEAVAEVIASKRRRRMKRANLRKAVSDEAFTSGRFEEDRFSDISSTCHGGFPCSLLHEACEAGLSALERLLNSRAIYSNEVVAYLSAVELILLQQLAKDEVDVGLKCAVIRVLTASVLGGGSGRMKGAASISFLSSIRTFESVAIDSWSNVELSAVASGALASCEALIHPRGPPLWAACEDQKIGSPADHNVAFRPMPSAHRQDLSDEKDCLQAAVNDEGELEDRQRGRMQNPVVVRDAKLALRREDDSARDRSGLDRIIPATNVGGSCFEKDDFTCNKEHPVHQTNHSTGSKEQSPSSLAECRMSCRDTELAVSNGKTISAVVSNLSNPDDIYPMMTKMSESPSLASSQHEHLAYSKVILSTTRRPEKGKFSGSSTSKTARTNQVPPTLADPDGCDVENMEDVKGGGEKNTDPIGENRICENAAEARYLDEEVDPDDAEDVIASIVITSPDAQD